MVMQCLLSKVILRFVFTKISTTTSQSGMAPSESDPHRAQGAPVNALAWKVLSLAALAKTKRLNGEVLAVITERHISGHASTTHLVVLTQLRVTWDVWSVIGVT